MTELVHDGDGGEGGQGQLRVPRKKTVTDGLDMVEGNAVDDNEHKSEDLPMAKDVLEEQERSVTDQVLEVVEKKGLVGDVTELVLYHS